MNRRGLRHWKMGLGSLASPLGRALVSVCALTACQGKLREGRDIEAVASNEPGTTSAAPMAGSAAMGSGTDASVTVGTEDPTRNVTAIAADGEQSDGNERGACASDAGICSPADSGVESACPGCVLDGSCVAPDVVNTANRCQICDPRRNAVGWSANDGAPCDDALFCTTDDSCKGGVCSGVARVCEDGVACNGISTCDEAAGKCSDPVNGCGANQVCDVTQDACVSTCQGCLVAGVCLPAGAEAAGNPCSVCNPAVSTTAYSAALGKSCGSGPSPCSQQDTCDAQGRCQANHLPVNTACGNSSSSACDLPDSCDGNGNCLSNAAANDTACNSVPSGSCQGGQCVAPRQANGTPCTSPAQCLSGFCRPWFLDIDGDAFGSGVSQMLCSPSPDQDQNSFMASGLITAILSDSFGRKFSSRGDDCCDSNSAGGSSVFPQNTNPFTTPQRACPSVKPFDYNCDGLETDQANNALVSQGCDALCNSSLWVTLPACGQLGDYQQCSLVNGSCTLGAPSQGLRVCQ
jgi:hypothetical protein